MSLALNPFRGAGVLLSITFLVNLIALSTGLWLGLYLVTRSPRRPIAWLTSLTLWSLSSHFLNVLLALTPLSTANPAPAWLVPVLRVWRGTAPGGSNFWLQGWFMVPAVVFWHHATTLMRAPHPGPWARARVLIGYVGALVAAIVQANTAYILVASPGGDPLYLTVLEAGRLYPFALTLGLLLVAISLSDLIRCARSPATPILRKQFNMLILATLLASSVALLSVAGSSVGVRTPIVLTSLVLGASMVLTGHGVARYSAFVEGRTARRDFYHAALVSGLVLAFYLALTWVAVHYLGAPPLAYIFAAVVAVGTHFLVDAARYYRDASYYRREMRQNQASLRKLASLAGDPQELDHYLAIALDSLCASAEAVFGLILVFENDDARLAAAYRYYEGERRVSRQGLAADDVLHVKPGQFPPPLGEAALLIPLYGEADQLGALILGRPAHGISYSPADVDEFLYFTDRLGDVIWNARRKAEYAVQVTQGTDVPLPDVIAYPGQVPVQAVEDALRHVANYGHLGQHSLACLRVVKARVPPGAVTHLDVGKAVYGVLADAIEKLRPGVAPTTDPPAREWYPYVILHDAYLAGTSNRDIMSRLYISQGTFSRTRRSALRDLARALEEMEAAAS
jgi:hypothetical protein